MAGKVSTIHYAAAVGLLASLFAVSAQAQTTVGDLSTINSANILKTAQLAGAQLDAKLQKAHDESGGTPAASTGGMALSSAASGEHRTAADDPNPVVKGVFGANGSVYATFLYADGSTVDAKQGGTIPGGYTVAHLDAEHVALRRGGKTIEVGFSSSAPVVRTAAPTTPYPGGVVSMPMMPPMPTAASAQP